ncbi:hypothetical protein POM88_040848 [Heracleum sosnowskyi]|uniref:Uncharacterized protein n=1 Tax=Heracleum sosnowskyi TaxID=360622 RepID=A0AAD8HD16_9APIA|nr:hypothetical protein POM88_040848 [Heracleum sosnowskyi]
MPGTIQVSVLEFKGIASSSPPSSVFIKVSLGKTEYQTWDKGDFSFPLTTLRDSLTVTIQDSKGNDISKIGVHSMAIVEKGIWDDLFPLEEGGHVHMKLQFSLSEEDRNRIRGVRESALKKKQREELSKDVRYSKMAREDAGYSVTSYSPINHEVSGEVAGFPYPDTISRISQRNNGKEKATLQKHIAPNATDNSEESSSSKMLPRTEVRHMPVRKNDTELPHFVVSEAPTLSQDISLISGGTESVVAKIKPVLSRPEDISVSKHEKQFPPRKPASSILKMISAFETTPVQQEKKTPVIQVAAKSQLNRGRKEGPSKDQVFSHVTKAPESNSGRPEYLTDLSSGRLGNEDVSSSGRLLSSQISSERFGNPSISGKPQQLPPDSMNKGKHIDFPNDIGVPKSSAATRQLLISSTSSVQQEKAHEIVTSELKSNHKEMKKQRDKSPEVLRETSLGSRKDNVLPEIKNRGEHDDLFKDLKHSEDAGQVTESSAIKVESAEADAIFKSKSESNIEESLKDQDHSSTDERSSASKASTDLKQMKEKGSVKLQPSNVYDWQKGSDTPSIFKGLKEVKAKYSNEFLGTLNEKQNTVVSHEDEQHRPESSTAWIFPNDARRMCVTTGVTAVIDLYDGCQAEGKVAVGSEEMKESESDTLNLRNRKPESWGDNAFTGSVKHAIKIAIVVGFGALVLFTRQREPRKSSRKAEDPFFRTLPYTDLQTSIEK